MLAPNPVVSGLTAARNLIADPDHWTQNTLARNARHRAVGTGSLTATRFCAQGALLRIFGFEIDDYVRADGLLTKAAYELFGMKYVTVNDYRGQRDVVAVFERAIQMAVAGDYPESKPEPVMVSMGSGVSYDPCQQIYVSFGPTSGAGGGGSYTPAMQFMTVGA